MTDETDTTPVKYLTLENQSEPPSKVRKKSNQEKEELQKTGEIRKIEICRLANRVGKEWYMLGIALGYSPNQLDQLQEIFPQKPAYRNFVMLWKWYHVALAHTKEEFNVIRQCLSVAFVESGHASLAAEISNQQQDISKDFLEEISKVNFDNSGEKEIQKSWWYPLSQLGKEVQGEMSGVRVVEETDISKEQEERMEKVNTAEEEDLKEIRKIAYRIGKEWQMLGIALGFFPNQLHNLQEQFPQEPNYRNFIMLWKWYSKAFEYSKGNINTIRQYLSNALLDAGNHYLAGEISNQKQDVPKELEEKIEVLKFYQTEEEGTIQSIILSWIKADETFFETEACKISLNRLETDGNVTIVGAPGDGKTAIGIHLALEYYQRGYKIYNVHSVNDIMKSHRDFCQQIFIIDDPIGVHVMDDERVKAWVSYSTEIEAFIQNGGTKLIATVRKNIMNSCHEQIRKTMLLKNQVDLTVIHCSPQEKEGILLKQAGGKLDKGEMKHLIEPKYYPAFPLLCHFIVKGSKHISNYSARQKPTSVIYSLIEELANTQRFQYCALVMVAMHDGKFDQQDLDDLEDQRKIRKVIELCGLDCSPNCLFNLGRSFDEMIGIYLTETKLGVEFLHDRIYSAVVFHFGSRHLNFLLKNCSSVFIRDMIRSENASLCGDWSNEDEWNLVVRVKKRNYESFAKRIVDDLINGYIVDVFLNPSIKDEEFQTFLAVQFIELPLLDLKNLLSRLPQNLFKEKSRREGKTSLDFGVLTSTPFHWICKLGLHKLYTAVLGQIPDKESFVKSIQGHTSPLHFAAGFGHFEIVKSLVEMGVDVNSRSKLECDDNTVGEYYPRFTPIFYAVRQNHLEVADFLLRSGANPDLVRDHGASPMLLAADKGHYRMIKTLLDYSADPNICCSHGTSPLFIASQEGHKDAVRVLIEGGAKINYQNFQKKDLTPLHIAVKNGHYNTSKVLLDKGANPNLSDFDGNTTLHFAVSTENANLVKLLLLYGGDPNLKNKQNETPRSPSSERAGLRDIFHSVDITMLNKH